MTEPVRLISRYLLAISNKLKQPLTFEMLPKLRRKFGTDAVSLQAPSVWQTSDTELDVQKNRVSWQDKTIADGRM